MNPISALIFIVFTGGAVLSFLAHMPLAVTIVLALIGIFLGYAVKMAQQWERAVVLRLGKLHAVKGPGLFLLVPIFDQVAVWIDQRIRTSQFSAEQALTRDTVPVNVDAIVFWMVHDPERAALEIADYASAVERVAQTSLREMIGSTLLSGLLADRKEADATLKQVIGAKTAEWGVTVNSVEIRDVAIPHPLSEDGNAFTAALSWQGMDWLKITGEAVLMHSRRREYTFVGVPSGALGQAEYQLDAKFFF